MADVLIASSKPTPEEPVDKVICGICRRQFSKYTCPTCNVAYCSLICFRSEPHSQCSETFYRKEVETGIQSEPSKSADEKRKMMALLKRIEEQSREDELNPFEAEEDEDHEHTTDDLVQRLGDLDIESASPHALWAILTPEEREKFTRALDDPSSELAQQLLASEELQSERLAPWWEAPDLDDTTQSIPAKRYGVKPEAVSIPFAVPSTSTAGSPLIYNICAVCVAYAYAVRYFATSPLSSLKTDDQDLQEASRIISQLVPCLTDRKSKVLHPSLPDVVTDIWSRFEPGNMNTKLFSLLLHDAARLLRPRVVTTILPAPFNTQGAELSVDPNHPNISAILAFSDLLKLFGLVDPRNAPCKMESRPNHITLKLYFYVAQILSTPPAILGRVAGEIFTHSKVIEQEVSSPSSTTDPCALFGNRKDSQVPNTSPDLRQDEVPVEPKIEMLT